MNKKRGVGGGAAVVNNELSNLVNLCALTKNCPIYRQPTHTTLYCVHVML